MSQRVAELGEATFHPESTSVIAELRTSKHPTDNELHDLHNDIKRFYYRQGGVYRPFADIIPKIIIPLECREGCTGSLHISFGAEYTSVDICRPTQNAYTIVDVESIKFPVDNSGGQPYFCEFTCTEEEIEQNILESVRLPKHRITRERYNNFFAVVNSEPAQDGPAPSTLGKRSFARGLFRALVGRSDNDK